MTSIVLGPIFNQPLHPASWCDYGRRRGGAGCPRYDYRVTNTFDGPDLLNGGTHRAVDAGNAATDFPVLAPAACRARGRRHHDSALGVEFDLGHGLNLQLWHLGATLAVPVVQGKSTEGGWQRVEKGQAIGRTGATGARLADGSPMPAHTHVELRRDGQLVDPEPHLFGAPIVIEEDFEMLTATGWSHVVNRQGALTDASNFRATPQLGDNVVAVFPKGTAVVPVGQARGEAVGTNDRWLLCAMWVGQTADGAKLGKTVVGFFHSSVVGELAAVEAVGDPKRLASIASAADEIVRAAGAIQELAR